MHLIKYFYPLASFCLLILISPGALADSITSNGNGLRITVSKAYQSSTNLEEQARTIAAGDTLVVSLDERLVLRGEHSKRSFSPLNNNSRNSKSVMNVAGFKVSERAREVSFLHLYTGVKDGEAIKVCEVIFLDDLLNDVDQQELRISLAAQGGLIQEENDLTTVSCARGR